MNTQKHTPTPWQIAGRNAVGYVIGHVGSEPRRIAQLRIDGHQKDTVMANAAFIVQCVNSHDALVDALTFLRAHASHTHSYRGQLTISEWSALGEALAKAEAALRLARGEDA